jgi:ABC-type amino acid transport substrate-binding protein
MKKIISLVLATALTATLFVGCAKESNTITMYTNAEFPPFEYRQGETIVGVDADIAKEIAKDMGKTLKIEDVKFDSIIPAVKAGKADFGAAGMTVNEERLEEVDFSIKYIKTTQYVIIKEGDTFTNLSSLAGKTIGVQTGTTGDIYVATPEVNGKKEKGKMIKGAIQDTGAKIEPYDNALIAAQALMAGKINAVIIDELPAKAIVEANKGIKAMEFKYDDGSNFVDEYAIAVKKGNKKMLDAVNKTLKRLISEGKIGEYLNKHTGAK